MSAAATKMFPAIRWFISLSPPLALKPLADVFDSQKHVREAPNAAFLFQTKFQERSIACEPTECHFALGDYFSGLQLSQRAGQNRGAVYFVQALILDFG